MISLCLFVACLLVCSVVVFCLSVCLFVCLFVCCLLASWFIFFLFVCFKFLWFCGRSMKMKVGGAGSSLLRSRCVTRPNNGCAVKETKPGVENQFSSPHSSRGFAASFSRLRRSKLQQNRQSSNFLILQPR